MAATTNQNNDISHRLRFDPWGNAQPGFEEIGQLLRYTARELDDLTGLYQYRARWYDPQLARFISQDPIGLAGGINPYAYAAGDPVNQRDPSGLSPGCTGDVYCYPLTVVGVGGVVDYIPGLPIFRQGFDVNNSSINRNEYTGRNRVSEVENGYWHTPRGLTKERQDTPRANDRCDSSTFKAAIADEATAGAVLGTAYGTYAGVVYGATGGRLFGGTVGSVIGAPVGPVGAVLGAAFGGQAGSTAGAVAGGWVVAMLDSTLAMRAVRSPAPWGLA